MNDRLKRRIRLDKPPKPVMTKPDPLARAKAAYAELVRRFKNK